MDDGQSRWSAGWFHAAQSVLMTLAAVLAEPLPCFYVLANTRALPAAEAAARAEEIGTNLRAAAARVGIDPARIAGTYCPWKTLPPPSRSSV